MCSNIHINNIGNNINTKWTEAFINTNPSLPLRRRPETLSYFNPPPPTLALYSHSNALSPSPFNFPPPSLALTVHPHINALPPSVYYHHIIHIWTPAMCAGLVALLSKFPWRNVTDSIEILWRGFTQQLVGLAERPRSASSGFDAWNQHLIQGCGQPRTDRRRPCGSRV